jgi:uncharacterized protein YndB with AHSA1/START domain
MYEFECEATFEAEPDAVWKVWTDVARWPDWDVSKEMARLDGPFEPGISGWAKQRGNLGGAFTITEVDAGRRPGDQAGGGPGRVRAPAAAVRPQDAPRDR